LREIARAFIAGLGSWRQSKNPRGVFLFGGPTGVGKTETALLLSKIFGNGKEQLIRIDCNTLQGSGHDSGPARSQLLGSPPGYIGYVRGQGGLLSKIRDMPESIVLFDEFEKSHPGVGELLLQIIDNGRIEDVDGNVLDFRRSYIIFTTNAGCIYDFRKLGFQKENLDLPDTPRADPEAMKRELRARGLGEEFLGRIGHIIVFNGLSGESIHEIVAHQLNGLKHTAELKGFELEWTDSFESHLSSQWQPRFGVRHLTTILRNRITEQLSLADAEGELEGVSGIRLELMSHQEVLELPDVAGLAARTREGTTLVIKLA
jgi:ATP-dependent Clp protease ATP-binding subunit ClpA